MNKIKITPLVLLAGCLIIAALWVFFFREPKGGEPYWEIAQWLLPVIFIFMALVAGGIHLLLRKNIPEFKKIWIIEGIVVGFVILFVALQTYPMML